MPQTQSWEFLIQQEGDRSWLPIDAPTVEILEGCYRIAARSSLKNVSVDVRIVHDAIQEDPPKRRTQTRTHQTNAKGLMVVIPYTRLQPGHWKFDCAVNALKHSLGLQVLSIESDVVEDWDWEQESEAGFVEPLDAPETSARLPLSSESVEEFLHHAEQMSEQMADQVLQEYGLTIESEPEEAPSEVVSPVIATASDVELVLEQETYVAGRGQTLTLSGVIQSTESQEVALERVQLRVCLQDPQTASTLLQTCETIEHQSLPFELTYRVTLPTELKTQLILGKVALHDLSEEAEPILASQAFTLIADVSDLLDAVNALPKSDETDRNREFAEEVLENAATPKPVERSPLNLTFLNFVEAPKNPQAANFAPLLDRPLPPKITQPDSQKSSRKPIDLPFSGEAPVGLASKEPEDLQLEIPLDQLLPPVEAPAQTPSETEALPLIEVPDQAEPAIAPQASSEIVAAPNPENSFLERLNSLAVDSDLADQLKVHADDVYAVTDEESSSFVTIDITPSPDPIVSEFVVDDEPILPLAELMISRRKQPQTSTQVVVSLLVLPENQPVPVPSLQIIEEELIAGKPLTVYVRLPDILPKLYAKVWINDRRNRTVLEPPRSVVEFTSNGLGSLEAMVKIPVPSGSAEIQIEAIAIEVMTNRESHKASLDRSVIPDELPDLWLDDLES